MAPTPTKIQIEDGPLINCYGEVRPNSNFYITFDDEYQDGFYCDGNPARDDLSFANWTEVAKYLYTNYRTDIVEISTC